MRPAASLTSKSVDILHDAVFASLSTNARLLRSSYPINQAEVTHTTITFISTIENFRALENTHKS